MATLRPRAPRRSRRSPCRSCARTRPSLALWDFKVSRPDLFTIWAGDVGVALGVEARHETYTDDRDPRVDGTITYTDAVTGVNYPTRRRGHEQLAGRAWQAHGGVGLRGTQIPVVSPDMNIPLHEPPRPSDRRAGRALQRRRQRREAEGGRRLGHRAWRTPAGVLVEGLPRPEPGATQRLRGQPQQQPHRLHLLRGRPAGQAHHQLQPVRTQPGDPGPAGRQRGPGAGNVHLAVLRHGAGVRSSCRGSSATRRSPSTSGRSSSRTSSACSARATR